MDRAIRVFLLRVPDIALALSVAHLHLHSRYPLEHVRLGSRSHLG